MSTSARRADYPFHWEEGYDPEVDYDALVAARNGQPVINETKAEQARIHTERDKKKEQSTP